MTGARIAFTLDDKGFNTGIQKLGGVLKTGIMRPISQAMADQTRLRFDTATDPFGQKWHALLPAYAAIKKGPGISSVYSGYRLGWANGDVPGFQMQSPWLLPFTVMATTRLAMTVKGMLCFSRRLT